MARADIFRVTDSGRLLQLAILRPLATIVSVDGLRPVIDHAPALCRETDGVVSVRFFLDAESATCSVIQRTGRALVVFAGPSSYISPDWYGVGPHGPSWNYLTAEAEGPCRAIETDQSVELFDALTASFEQKLWPKEPWDRHALSEPDFHAMFSSMYAFELVAERFEGVRKLSQNQRRNARQSAGEALALSGGDPAIAAMMMNDIS